MAKARILVVEDSMTAAMYVCNSLKEIGYPQPEIVSSGEEAIKKAKEIHPDLVIMDIVLEGDMDGIEASEHIRSRFNIPVIFLTSHFDEETVERAASTEAFGYLHKPFREKELNTTIEMALYKHKMEMKLKESELWLATTIASIGEAIIATDVNGIITIMNPVAEALTGWTSAEALGNHSSDVIHILDAKKFNLYKKLIEEALRHGKIAKIDEPITLAGKDGTEIPIECSVAPIRRNGGIISGAVLVLKDISERRQVEEALRKEHVQKQQLLEALPSILIGLNQNEEITHWNSPAESTFSIAATDAIGQLFEKCNINWDWQKIKSQIAKCRQEEQPIQVSDIKFTRQNGQEGFLNITIKPFSNKTINKSGFLLIGSDVTERKKLEYELIQAQKLESIGQLAAGIAHEINTPIQYVGDNTRFLQEGFTSICKFFDKCQQLYIAAMIKSLTPELVAELQRVAEDEDIEFLFKEIPSAILQTLEGVDRVTHIVRAMKEFSHPDVKQKSTIDINRAIENTITVSRNEWKYVADMETNFDHNLHQVTCYPGEFSQVILNLIINAAHAIAEAGKEKPETKGKITVATCGNGKWAEIRVSDTGTGIPEQVRTKIFDPFFTTKEVGRGTGQGLAIARSVVVDQLCGTITFETEMGKGTTFIIRLPMESITESERK